jgi:hypothetical protein
LSSLISINLLGVGSVAIFFELGGSTIQPAQANLPEQQATRLEQSQASQPNHFKESLAQKNVSGSAATSEELADSSSITELSRTLEENPKGRELLALVQGDTVVEPLSGEVPATSSPQLAAPPVVQPSSTSVSKESSVTPKSADNSNLGSQRMSAVSQIGCTSETICSQAVPSPMPMVPSDSSNSALAQLPYFLQTPLSPLVQPTPSSVDSNPSNPTLGQLPSFPQTPSVPATVLPMGANTYNPTGGQSPYFPQTILLVPVPAMALPMGTSSYNSTVEQFPYSPQTALPLPAPLPPNQAGFNNYNPTGGQPGYLPQTVLLMPVPATALPTGGNTYNPAAGQPGYLPQTVLLMPVPATGLPTGGNSYNPAAGQSGYLPQTVLLMPVPATALPTGGNSYNPAGGQPSYLPQTVLLMPVPATALPMGANSYNPAAGQFPYSPQTAPPLPAPLPTNPVGFNNYNPTVGQSPYSPQIAPPLPTNPVGFNNYNPTVGQSPYLPQTAPPQPAPIPPNPAGFNNYNPAGGQPPNFQQTQPLPPNPPNPNFTPPPATPTSKLGEVPSTQQPSLSRRTALTEPSLQLQGIYINQGDQSSARARLSGLYPLNPQLQFGATLDLITGEDIFADSRGEGLNINQLYFAAAPFADVPNLRFVVGQLDLTSYFDRNSFAKDGARDFFNPIFQTNSALSTTGISSRPGVLVNWTLTDNIEAKAAVFSSAQNIGDFSLDGFAGEIGIRYGNAIIRGTYASDQDAGLRDGFREIFRIRRGTDQFGLLPSDREQSYGINAEVFVPQLNMGLFGRYGRYENRAVALGADTYSIGLNFLDLFTQNDRLGLAYGRSLSNDQLRREAGDKVPDVLELFYDFRFLPNLRIGFTIQERNGFSETYGGFRVKTEFDVTPRGRLAQ